MGRLQEYLGPRLEHREGVWVLDGSDFPKQGVKSVGVGNCSGGFQYVMVVNGHIGDDARCHLRHLAGCGHSAHAFWYAVIMAQRSRDLEHPLA